MWKGGGGGDGVGGYGQVPCKARVRFVMHF